MKKEYWKGFHKWGSKTPTYLQNFEIPVEMATLLFYSIHCVKLKQNTMNVPVLDICSFKYQFQIYKIRSNSQTTLGRKGGRR